MSILSWWKNSLKSCNLFTEQINNTDTSPSLILVNEDCTFKICASLMHLLRMTTNFLIRYFQRQFMLFYHITSSNIWNFLQNTSKLYEENQQEHMSLCWTTRRVILRGKVTRTMKTAMEKPFPLTDRQLQIHPAPISVVKCVKYYYLWNILLSSNSTTGTQFIKRIGKSSTKQHNLELYFLHLRLHNGWDSNNRSFGRI